MKTTELGISISFIFVHPENANAGIVSIDRGSDTFTSDEHPLKISHPIDLTDSGSEISVSDLQFC